MGIIIIPVRTGRYIGPRIYYVLLVYTSLPVHIYSTVLYCIYEYILKRNWCVPRVPTRLPSTPSTVPYSVDMCCLATVILVEVKSKEKEWIMSQARYGGLHALPCRRAHTTHHYSKRILHPCPHLCYGTRSTVYTSRTNSLYSVLRMPVLIIRTGL